ncbi:hypothetical protein V1525DRAFT_425325 [Lipomyces kononenkoae]|uniref:Uncharacterized protein n=1 Tax=Lipomyces kononenkoae TaxID=34357 RepID=A0ACC3T4K7_LIPKO
MKAVRIHDNETASPNRYSADNPAPPSALVLDSNVPIPQITQTDEVLIRVHAATVTRDELTWPETYSGDRIPGHDFAGTVVAVSSDVKDRFNPGDEVYGVSLSEGKGSTWAEYAVVASDEVSLKPKLLDWAQAATVPMSALTAWQALFDKAGIPPPDLNRSQKRGFQGGQSKGKLLITGASGAVGAYLVQLAALAGLHTVASTTSNDRNRAFLMSLGANDAFEYKELEGMREEYDIVIDTVGGTVLEQCWSYVKDDGKLITIDSSSYDFVENHRQKPFTTGKEKVQAVFFIVKPSVEELEQLASALDQELLQVFVAQTLPLEEARQAYELASARSGRRGKIVVTISRHNEPLC